MCGIVRIAASKLSRRFAPMGQHLGCTPDRCVGYLTTGSIGRSQTHPRRHPTKTTISSRARCLVWRGNRTGKHGNALLPDVRASRSVRLDNGPGASGAVLEHLCRGGSRPTCPGMPGRWGKLPLACRVGTAKVSVPAALRRRAELDDVDTGFTSMRSRSELRA